MRSLCLRGLGAWWMVAGTDQARHSANQIPASKFPLPPPPQPAGPTIPRVIRLEEMDTASSLGHWNWYRGLLIFMSQSLLLELPS